MPPINHICKFCSFVHPSESGIKGHMKQHKDLIASRDLQINDCFRTANYLEQFFGVKLTLLNFIFGSAGFYISFITGV